MARNFKRDRKGRFAKVNSLGRSAASGKGTKLTQGVHSRHKKHIATVQGASMAGSGVGRNIGRATGRGPLAEMAGSYAGRYVGAKVGNKISVKRGYAISDKEYDSLGEADQKAITRRNKNVHRAALGLSVARSVSGVNGNIIASKVSDKYQGARIGSKVITAREAGTVRYVPNRKGVYVPSRKQ